MSDNGRHVGDWIETTDEHGDVHFFEKIDEIEFEGQQYALLIYQGRGSEEGGPKQPEEGEEGYEEEIVVMKISYEDDAEVFEAIEDEDEFERVVQYIEKLADEAEDEDDEEEDEEE
jgi:hypothetical protein